MYYILDENHEVKPTMNVKEFAESFENFKRRVVKNDYLENDVRVSTVFLGLDYDFTWRSITVINPKPLVFETLIFGGENDGYQKRYSTWDEAIKGHEAAVNLVNGSKGGNKCQIKNM